MIKISNPQDSLISEFSTSESVKATINSSGKGHLNSPP